MKIRTQLMAGFVIFAILLALISGLVFVTNNQLDRLLTQSEIANDIALGLGDLGYLSNDYILYREPQQAERLYAKFATISGDIARLSPDTPEQQAIAENLAANLQNSRAVFDDIASSPVQPGGADTSFVQLSWSRMAVQNQGMIFDAVRLATLIRTEEEGVKQQRNIFIFALMAAFAAFLLTSYLLFFRRMLRSLGNLRQGAGIVGSGNFSYTFKEVSDDEIGDLTRTFNQMTANLREVTASKADLEREVIVRKKTEEELGQKNEALSAMNEELNVTQEELQKNQAKLREALTEKEVLLSEIHHRVKNNLTAFISLLSLEGSYNDTPAGVALKKDLQNRARSMALIHETLYRTRKFAGVEMDLYLRTLVGQITGTYALPGALEVQVGSGEIVLDLSRATTCGLIVNELVTNSLKYAFSTPFDSGRDRDGPCKITVTLTEEGDNYVLRIQDNGVGLPAGFDALHAKSLGLKLVSFLAKHQLRATIDVRTDEGTEFIFRFPKDPRQSLDRT